MSHCFRLQDENLDSSSRSAGGVTASGLDTHSAGTAPSDSTGRRAESREQLSEHRSKRPRLERMVRDASPLSRSPERCVRHFTSDSGRLSACLEQEHDRKLWLQLCPQEASALEPLGSRRHHACPEIQSAFVGRRARLVSSWSMTTAGMSVIGTAARLRTTERWTSRVKLPS